MEADKGQAVIFAPIGVMKEGEFSKGGLDLILGRSLTYPQR